MSKSRQARSRHAVVVGRQIEMSQRERTKLEGLCQQQQGFQAQLQQLQNQMQQLAVQIEQTKGKVSAVAEMICEAHGVDPQRVRADWDGQRVTFTLLPIVLPDEPTAEAARAQANGATAARA